MKLVILVCDQITHLQTIKCFVGYHDEKKLPQQDQLAVFNTVQIAPHQYILINIYFWLISLWESSLLLCRENNSCLCVDTGKEIKNTLLPILLFRHSVHSIETLSKHLKAQILTMALYLILQKFTCNFKVCGKELPLNYVILSDDSD